MKSFLGTHRSSTIYTGELEGIQDSLSYALGHNQVSEIPIFTDNQAALQALEDPNRCSAPQIMQKIMRHIDDLKTRSTPVHLYLIPAHTNIKGNEEADIIVKKGTGWRRAKRRNGK